MTDEAATRGRLEIADRVVSKLARQAAREVSGVRAESQTGLGGAIGRSLPSASADVAGDRVRIAVEIAVAWPTPLAEVTSQVRASVHERITELAGLHVDTVDVTATKIVHPPAERPRLR